jgi:hypothetical protein
VAFERQPYTECAASRALAGSTCIAGSEMIECSLSDPNIWPRREPSCYPKDIAKHKLAARKKTSLNTSSPVDQRLLLNRLLSVSFHDFFPLGHVRGKT